MQRVSKGEAHFEPFDVIQVSRDATEERGCDAHGGEIELANGDAALCYAREDLLGRATTDHQLASPPTAVAAAATATAPAITTTAVIAMAFYEAERLHGSSREDGRGRGGVPAEGAQLRHVGGREAQRAVVVAAQSEVE